MSHEPIKKLVKSNIAIFSEQLQSYINCCKAAKKEIVVKVGEQCVPLDAIYDFNTKNFDQADLLPGDIQIPSNEDQANVMNSAASAAATDNIITVSHRLLNFDNFFRVFVIGENDENIQKLCILSENGKLCSRSTWYSVNGEARGHAYYNRVLNDRTVIRNEVVALPGYLESDATRRTDANAILLYVDFDKLGNRPVDLLLNWIERKTYVLNKTFSCKNIFIVFMNKSLNYDKADCIHNSKIQTTIAELKKQGVIEVFSYHVSVNAEIANLIFESINAYLITRAKRCTESLQTAARSSSSNFFGLTKEKNRNTINQAPIDLISTMEAVAEQRALAKSSR